MLPNSSEEEYSWRKKFIYWSL